MCGFITTTLTIYVTDLTLLREIMLNITYLYYLSVQIEANIYGSVENTAKLTTLIWSSLETAGSYGPSETCHTYSKAILYATGRKPVEQCLNVSAHTHTCTLPANKI
jgi:hypothetical protein